MAKNPTSQTNPGAAFGGCVVIVIAAAVFLGIVFVTIQSASFIVTRFSAWGAKIDPEVMAALVGVPLTFAVTYWGATKQIRNRTVEYMNSRKIEIYHEFMSFLAIALETVEQQDEVTIDSDSDHKHAIQLITHGSNNVVKLFKQWKVAEEGHDSPQALLFAGKLLLEIRKDLKMSNKGITGEDLLRCISNIRRQAGGP